MAFAAGQFLTASLLNNTFTASDEDTQNTLGSTTSTTFTATLTGGTACGVAFIAPLSGVVLVCNNSFVENTGTARSYCTFRLRTGSTIGSGTDIVAAADENSISILGSAGDDMASGRTFRVPGLIPGTNYNVQQLFRVSGSTGNFAWKRLSVYPVPA
jgi:hypothetical protein